MPLGVQLLAVARQNMLAGASVHTFQHYIAYKHQYL